MKQKQKSKPMTQIQMAMIDLEKAITDSERMSSNLHHRLYEAKEIARIMNTPMGRISVILIRETYNQMEIVKNRLNLLMHEIGEKP